MDGSGLIMDPASQLPVDERWMSRLRSSPVSPLDDENFLRLLPQPSALPRASLVCKCWRRILSDPAFLKRFREHHRKPPLLGFFDKEWGKGAPVFNPVLDPLNRIHAERFSVPKSHNPSDRWGFMVCRHGLAVLVDASQRETVVWDPLSGQHHRVPFPPGLDEDKGMYWCATVLCIDDEDGHVHGDCFSSPFKLVLVCDGDTHAFACLYESASGVWGDIISMATMDDISHIRPSFLVRNALYWLLWGGDILVFDFEMQSFGVIEKPAHNHVTGNRCFQLLRMEDGGLGLAVLSELTIQIWERKSNCDGVVGWVLLHNIPLEGMFQWRMRSDHKMVLLVGYDEDTNVIVLSTMIGNFMLQLDSMQIRHIIKRDNICYDTFYYYTNFCTAGKEVGWKWLNLKL